MLEKNGWGNCLIAFVLLGCSKGDNGVAASRIDISQVKDSSFLNSCKDPIKAAGVYDSREVGNLKCDGLSFAIPNLPHVLNGKKIIVYGKLDGIREFRGRTSTGDVGATSRPPEGYTGWFVIKVEQWEPDGWILSEEDLEEIEAYKKMIEEEKRLESVDYSDDPE